jgi:hypothetical protein
VWSPSFLDPIRQESSKMLGPENLDVVNLDIPWLDQMRDREQSPKKNAKTSNHNICDAKEGVLPSYNGSSGE